MIATMDDVLECFSDRSNPEGAFCRLVREWADRFCVIVNPMLPDSIFRAELCPTETAEHLSELCEAHSLMATDQEPRRTDGPIVVVRFSNGRVGQVDGRRRLNKAVREGLGVEALICVY